MKVTVAKSAGFCFGVKRAVGMAYREAEKAAENGRSVYTLGPVIHNEYVVDDLAGKTLIVVKGTTAETFFEQEYPDVELQKYDQYADAYNALLDGRGDAFSTDNTEVLAWAKENPGFTVGIDALGNEDTIAAAVAKGNDTLLGFIDDEIKALADENFFHNAYDKTLAPVYGTDVDPDTLVVEGGAI